MGTAASSSSKTTASRDEDQESCGGFLSCNRRCSSRSADNDSGPTTKKQAAKNAPSGTTTSSTSAKKRRPRRERGRKARAREQRAREALLLREEENNTPSAEAEVEDRGSHSENDRGGGDLCEAEVRAEQEETEAEDAGGEGGRNAGVEGGEDIEEEVGENGGEERREDGRKEGGATGRRGEEGGENDHGEEDGENGSGELEEAAGERHLRDEDDGDDQSIAREARAIAAETEYCDAASQISSPKPIPNTPTRPGVNRIREIMRGNDPRRTGSGEGDVTREKPWLAAKIIQDGYGHTYGYTGDDLSPSRGEEQHPCDADSSNSRTSYNGYNSNQFRDPCRDYEPRRLLDYENTRGGRSSKLVDDNLKYHFNQRRDHDHYYSREPELNNSQYCLTAEDINLSGLNRHEKRVALQSIVCRHYLAGSCTKGSYCRFKHPVNPRDFGSETLSQHAMLASGGCINVTRRARFDGFHGPPLPPEKRGQYLRDFHERLLDGRSLWDADRSEINLQRAAGAPLWEGGERSWEGYNTNDVGPRSERGDIFRRARNGGSASGCGSATSSSGRDERECNHINDRAGQYEHVSRDVDDCDRSWPSPVSYGNGGEAGGSTWRRSPQRRGRYKAYTSDDGYLTRGDYGGRPDHQQGDYGGLPDHQQGDYGGLPDLQQGDYGGRPDHQHDDYGGLPDHLQHDDYSGRPEYQREPAPGQQEVCFEQHAARNDPTHILDNYNYRQDAPRSGPMLGLDEKNAQICTVTALLLSLGASAGKTQVTSDQKERALEAVRKLLDRPRMSPGSTTSQVGLETAAASSNLSASSIDSPDSVEGCAVEEEFLGHQYYDDAAASCSEVAPGGGLQAGAYFELLRRGGPTSGAKEPGLQARH